MAGDPFVTDAAPVAVGLVGAGRWARRVTGPALAAGPDTVLVGVWSRSAASTAAAAAELGVAAAGSAEELFDRCAAVALSVPPAAQPALAVAAGRAGCALLLEKPLAVDAVSALRLRDAVLELGVPSMMALTYRYSAAAGPYLRHCRAVPPTGLRGLFVSGAGLSGPPGEQDWRDENGVLLDLGPHLLDLAESAAGPIEELSAVGDRGRWVSLLLRHGSGTVSDLSLSSRIGVPRHRIVLDALDRQGLRSFDLSAAPQDGAADRLVADFARVVRGAGEAPGDAWPPSDVARGAALSEWIDRAQRALAV
ncbi:Gfo/Idh/MocA family protein [Nakamurella endophytica]|uniref:Dehydrogenase n=1 Tax=Nakamurella endophytica TaxID=1748367 RepID=A0A917TAJ8_9ACTN|nr:Gfo/Idh/MocA family oxidoreductase [Nakamurella endophytica]GGM16645.1 dehydrogenase [Nakamurella endophytica]